MIIRIPQRRVEDCVICVVAMVLGYSYERVDADAAKYPKQTHDGKFYEWWAPYIVAQGLRTDVRPFAEASRLQLAHGERAIGILGLTFEHLKRRHVSVLDGTDVIDPADAFPLPVQLPQYISMQRALGGVLDPDFRVIYR